MLRVEFHCHTLYSKDSLTSLESLLETCRRKQIDRVVITDHNTIAGAIQAQALDPERVIVGEEIATQGGELLAAFVREEIPPGLPPLEAIARLRQQGAFISVSHPFDRMRSGHWELPALLEITPLVDAIETFNARCMWPGFNRQAQEFALRRSIPGTAGSDAHVTREVGKALMLLPGFHDPESLRLSLPQVRFQASLSAPWIHFTSRYANLRKKMSKKIHH
jgi:predicted metal-dependent phosphoesterase TrpH